MIKANNTRITTKFLWLPTFVNEYFSRTKESKKLCWLKTVYVKQYFDTFTNTWKNSKDVLPFLKK